MPYWSRDDLKIEYRKVVYVCPNAPGRTKRSADGHTVGSYEYGNGAGARWGAAYRPKVCEKCGATLVTGSPKNIGEHLKEARKEV